MTDEHRKLKKDFCIFAQIQTLDPCDTMMTQCDWPMLDGRYISMPFATFCHSTNHGAIWWINKNSGASSRKYFDLLIQIFVKNTICQEYCILIRTSTVYMSRSLYL